MYKKLEVGTIEEGKLQCVFLLIYCRDGVPYEKYNLPEGRHAIPVVLSLGRHDGFIGFIGGKVDPGETLRQGLKREVWEETGLNIDIRKAVPLATFTDGKANIHSFTYEVSYGYLKRIVKKICNAEHFGIEITGFSLNHINKYVNEGGIDEIRKQNWKATGLMELEELIIKENLLYE